MNVRQTRILLVDDHEVVRTGYRTLLEMNEALAVVAEAGSADDAYAAYRKHRPDVVVMDIMLPGSSGIEATRRIVAFDEQARVLMFTMCSHPTVVQQALDAGAMGVLTKDSPADALVDGVQSIARGKRVLSRLVAESVAFSHYLPESKLFGYLTPREFEMCRLLVSGHSIERIAEQLNLSPKTVANKLSTARRKLDVNSDIELVKLASEVGLVPWVTERRIGLETTDTPRR
jgi:two-component system, NarL family, invasion response regulator UvrY